MNYLSVSLEKKCRICATDIFDGASGISIFSDVYLEEKIKKYLYINLSQSDELPKIICGSCFIKLEGIHRFACLALKTEENYLTYLSRKKYNEEHHSEDNDQIDQKPPLLLDELKIPVTKFKNSRKDSLKSTIKPYRQPKMRNTRHVDHITLEQIINDKIAKNFRAQNCEIIPIKNTLLCGGTTIELAAASTTTITKSTKNKKHSTTGTTLSRVPTTEETLAKIKSEISIVPYDDLKLGQYIKDQALLCLILKGLKWDNAAAIVNDSQMEKLKNTSFREVLANKNLLNDADLVELLKSCIGQEAFLDLQNNIVMKEELEEVMEPVDLSIVYSNRNTKGHKHNCSADSNNNNSGSSNDDDSVTQLEVKLDPELFFYDDEDNSSKGNDSKSEDIKVFKEEFDDSVSMSTTLKFSAKQKKFLCTICPEKFVSNVDLQEHIITHLMKPRDKLSILPSSSALLLSTNDTDIITTVTNRSIKLGLKSSKSKTRKQREKEKKMKEKYFECLICKKNLSTKGNLKTHMEIHRPRVKYSCDVCSKIFKSLINLVRHREYHNRFHRCSFCDKIYKNYADLKAHLNEHEDARPYQCPYCAKQFTNSGTFVSHKKRVHAEEILNKDLAAII